MSLRNVYLVFSISLIAITADTTALKCIKETACSCHLPDGDFYDLEKVAEQGVVKSSVEKDYQFYFQPCKNVHIDVPDVSPDLKNTTECDKGTGVSLCARHLKEVPFSLGSAEETKWNLLDSVVQLELMHLNYTTKITLTCCPTCNSSFLSFDQQPESSKFNLVLNTKAGCKIKGNLRGLSVGSVLVILLFVFVGVYLIVGALTLRFIAGAVGLELIPHYDYWCQVPGLFRDGVAYTFSGCSAHTYERI